MFDVDAEDLIARLSSGLAPPDRARLPQGCRDCTSNFARVLRCRFDLSRHRKDLARLLPSTSRNGRQRLVRDEDAAEQAHRNEAGYEVCLPKIRQRRHRKGRRIEVLSPLFPGNLFPRIEQPDHAADVLAQINH